MGLTCPTPRTGVVSTSVVFHLGGEHSAVPLGLQTFFPSHLQDDVEVFALCGVEMCLDTGGLAWATPGSGSGKTD